MKKGVPTPSPDRARPSIRSILLVLNLLVLLLPLGGIYFLRIYENELVRQTESELIAQAAFIGAVYQHEVSGLLAKTHRSAESFGRKVPVPKAEDGFFKPVPATLDLARDLVHPPRPDGVLPGQTPDPLAMDAGVEISPVLREAQRTTLSGIKLLDANGVVIAGQNELGQSFAGIEEVKTAMEGRHQSLLRKRVLNDKPPPLGSISRGADINVYVAFPVFLKDQLIGVVLVARTPMDIQKALYAKRNEIGLAALFVVLLAVAMSVFTSYTITRPMAALMAQSREIALGNQAPSFRVQTPVTREIASLSDSFARMAEALESRSQYIRQFATHVSHEFKTPLTAIQGAVELLREHPDDMPESQRSRFLSNIAQDTDRLKRLVNRLLELARADVVAPSGARADILKVASLLSQRYRDYSLMFSINNQTGLERLEVPVSPEILETILCNLLDNSLQHGASRVEMTLRLDGNALECRIQDDGSGITEANRKNLFTPFFTTHREKGGTGLGLSIVKALLASVHGEVVWTPSEAGACFTVRFPSCERD